MRHAQAAEWCDEPPARGVSERKIVDRGGEDVRDLLRDELLGRRHPDEERLRECADRSARLLAESSVRLVADDEVVRVAVELRAVPGEPRVRLDRDRAVDPGTGVGHDRVGEAVAVALRGEVALELRDEEPAVGEDQDSEVSRCLDEARGCDRLARCGRVPEAEASDGSRIRAGELLFDRLVLDVPGVEVVLALLVGIGIGRRAVRRMAVSVSVLLDRALRRGDELGEHARERVDLVTAKLRSRGGVRWILREHALEAEHEAVAHLPARRRVLTAGVDLDERVVECRTPCSPRCQGLRGVLVRHQERLAEPGLRSTCRRSQVLGCVRRQRRDGRSLGHSGSTLCRAAPS
jgi:hypothetical protein